MVETKIALHQMMNILNRSIVAELTNSGNPFDETQFREALRTTISLAEELLSDQANDS